MLSIIQIEIEVFTCLQFFSTLKIFIMILRKPNLWQYLPIQ